MVTTFPVRALLSVFLSLLMCMAFAAEAPPTPSLVGEQLFRFGKLPLAAALRGERAGGVFIEGELAACVNCHRRSGLGTTEGQIVIPPIIGKYLFRPTSSNIRDLNLPHVQGYRTQRGPYTDETLARVIREGINADGKTLNYLMPRYNLDDATMASLIAYLKELTTAPVPGVTEDTLHFATIITPEADPRLRKGMLDVLERFFADKNEYTRAGLRPIQSNAREITYRVKRRWQLHVWELNGPPENWQQQLQERLNAEPVYAVISGLGGKTWEPVHRFCEQQSLPCLFPNIDLPIDAEKDFYPIYFSKGVLLEAELIAHDLQTQSTQAALRRVIQVYRQDDLGATAALALKKNLLNNAVKIVNVPLSGAEMKADLAKLVRDSKAGDVVVLWLRPADLAALPTATGKINYVYASGIMAGLETAPLPAAWRSVSKLAYPYDLPDLRKIRMNYPLGWFKVRHITVVAEKVQSDTYLACGILAETLNEMLDSFVRDYLVERIEIMLSHRVITGYYPRLGLAPGQRFASKGGYLVRFAEAQGNKLVAEGEWIIP